MAVHSILCSSITALRPPGVMVPAIARSIWVKQPKGSSFSVLPEEIIVKILEWCDFGGVLACQLTCRALRDLVVGSTILRYKLALSEHGMCDGTSNELSTAEKLESLTAYVAAWGSLDSARPEKADALAGWSAPMAVSCNIIVFSKEDTDIGDRRDVARDGPDPHTDLLVLRVPSALRRVEAAQWTLTLPTGVREVCIEASQDLLIYVLDGAFHACTLSTGAVHPLVEHEGFFSMWGGSRRFDVFNLCVCGDFVAAATRVYFISVWNWKKGQLVSDQVSEVRFSSFDFLDEHHIIYAVSKEDSIYVYDLRRRLADQPVRFQLALPSINRAISSRYIQLRRNALPIGELRPSGGRLAGSPPPFHADPRERLIVLRVVTSPVERGEEQFELHIPARAFLHHFAAAGQRQGTDGGDVVLPWPAWRDVVRATAPRRLPYTVQVQMVAYGMRAVAHPPDRDEGVLHVDSYLPRARRRETAGVAEAAGGEKDGMRQAIALPGEAEGKADFLSVLCEDALLCYKLDSSRSTISDAYWYTF